MEIKKNEKKIGIIGASGYLGEKITIELLENLESNIVVAGRNEKILKEIFKKYEKRIEFFEVDIRNKKSLKKLYSKIDIVINVSRPIDNFSLFPCKVAIEEDILYIDAWMSILDEKEKIIHELDKKAKEKNVLLITGAGFVPGLSRFLLNYACKTLSIIENIQISAIFNDRVSFGSAVDILSSNRDREVFEKGVWIKKKFGYGKETIFFLPPVSKKVVFAAPPADLKHNLPENINNAILKSGSDIFLSRLITIVNSINPNNYKLKQILAKCLSISSNFNYFFKSNGLSITMTACGKKAKNESYKNISISLYYPDAYVGTSLSITLCVEYLIEKNLKKTGLFTMGEIVDPFWFICKLKSKGFKVKGI